MLIRWVGEHASYIHVSLGIWREWISAVSSLDPKKTFLVGNSWNVLDLLGDLAAPFPQKSHADPEGRGLLQRPRKNTVEGVQVLGITAPNRLWDSTAY
jgi:hypothetical protein